MRAWHETKRRREAAPGGQFVPLYDITSAFRTQRVRWAPERWPNPIEACLLREQESPQEARFQESMHHSRTTYDGRLRWAERLTR